MTKKIWTEQDWKGFNKLYIHSIYFCWVQIYSYLPVNCAKFSTCIYYTFNIFKNHKMFWKCQKVRTIYEEFYYSCVAGVYNGVKWQELKIPWSKRAEKDGHGDSTIHRVPVLSLGIGNLHPTHVSSGGEPAGCSGCGGEETACLREGHPTANSATSK